MAACPLQLRVPGSLLWRHQLRLRRAAWVHLTTGCGERQLCVLVAAGQQQHQAEAATLRRLAAPERAPGSADRRTAGAASSGSSSSDNSSSSSSSDHSSASSTHNSPGSRNSSRAGVGPQTVGEMDAVVAANVPVFFLHPKEQFYPCTVEWFLQRARLATLRKGRRHRVKEVLYPLGTLTPELLGQAARERPQTGMMLQLDARARAGQWDANLAAPDSLPPAELALPVYAHVKEVINPAGRRDALEINYMKFFAFNGWYKVFDVLYVGQLGAHDGDWEHVTVRLSPDGERVLGVYYSAHRHKDGVWRSADRVPRAPDGRPLAYVAINGHGSYPYPGMTPRVFGAFNDYTSDRGVVWRPSEQLPPAVVVVSGRGDPNAPLPQVDTRGNSLDGSHYPAVGSGASAPGGWSAGQAAQPASLNRHSNSSELGASSATSNSSDSNSSGDSFRPQPGDRARSASWAAAASSSSSGRGGAPGSESVLWQLGQPPASSSGESRLTGGAGRLPNLQQPNVVHDDAAWMDYHGRWGSTVVAPQLQEWFARAENPVSRTWLQQVFLPLAPGVDSIWEDVLDELDDALDTARESMHEAADSVEHAVHDAEERARERYEDALRRMHHLRERMEAAVRSKVDEQVYQDARRRLHEMREQLEATLRRKDGDKEGGKGDR